MDDTLNSTYTMHFQTAIPRDLAQLSSLQALPPSVTNGRDRGASMLTVVATVLSLPVIQATAEGFGLSPFASTCLALLLAGLGILTKNAYFRELHYVVL
ncbi:hypothetical protein SAMD00023353_2801650 [Rosellinia necatrix]|uniref:Uncharacterized protein n=1 Tax=Rosellinia necatrix TaxID=77044 RepID=A0A1W2TAI9_ROSNE|nr:hypothetical protein SAMD00023353_2801650 [Rosellinia necatrix]